jgi:hypothetical protein
MKALKQADLFLTSKVSQDSLENFLKQVKYLDSLRFYTAFSTKDDFLRPSDLEEDTEDLVECSFFSLEENKRVAT